MRKTVIGIGTISALFGGYSIFKKSYNPDELHHASNSDLNENLKLKLVQVVFRHGARTPLSSPEYLPKIKYTEEMLKHGQHTYVPYDTKNMHGENVDIAKTIYKQKDKTYGEKHHGELTAKGADQMHQLGVMLRKQYITDLQFVPSEFSDLITVRSTAVKRAVESARCTLAGKYKFYVNVFLT